eukprot:507376-Hanusia_phi.AAC.1
MKEIEGISFVFPRSYHVFPNQKRENELASSRLDHRILMLIIVAIPQRAIREDMFRGEVALNKIF